MIKQPICFCSDRGPVFKCSLLYLFRDLSLFCMVLNISIWAWSIKGECLTALRSQSTLASFPSLPCFFSFQLVLSIIHGGTRAFKNWEGLGTLTTRHVNNIRWMQGGNKGRIQHSNYILNFRFECFTALPMTSQEWEYLTWLVIRACFLYIYWVNNKYTQ